MRSLFARRSEPALFRISWRGYDRAQVDEFLRRTAADRQRLQEDLAQLEAVMTTSPDERREMERLAAVRREVASCLETSIGALRTATGLLGTVSTPGTASPGYGPVPVETTSRPEVRFGALQPLRPTLPSWPLVRRKPVLVGLGSVAALTFAGFLYQNQPRASEMPAPPAPVAAPVAAARPEPDAAAPAAAAPADREDGLVLTLTARRACWIGTTLDGGQRLERLLAPNETILLRANSEAVLRIGDATALAVLINNRPTRPLGATGQVVTHRITKANYRSLIVE